ncbi:hypothetical protein [Streptomyces sedi]|uniref:Uncharacterized protein n=1 Tax=Streptomyces sedi TaxID=555059 RepID=A0A5C4UQL5_9ACTN|nr:hypothetical protein [Streptomyces sedi]TNM25907.1 hypothetical protein FH715_25415 [Streptomyces sedi]
MAILYEATPEPAHVCLVWPKGAEESYRLDVSLKDYARLDRLSRVQQAEVMQRLMLRMVGKGAPKS